MGDRRGLHIHIHQLFPIHINETHILKGPVQWRANMPAVQSRPQPPIPQPAKLFRNQPSPRQREGKKNDQGELDYIYSGIGETLREVGVAPALALGGNGSVLGRRRFGWWIEEVRGYLHIYEIG